MRVGLFPCICTVVIHWAQGKPIRLLVRLYARCSIILIAEAKARGIEEENSMGFTGPIDYRFCMRILSICLSFSLFALSAPAVAGGLTPHRAEYAFKTLFLHSAVDFTAVSGTMSYVWSESCEAYHLEQRYDLHYALPTGRTEHIATCFAAWEARDGSRYRFSMSRSRDDGGVEEIRGGADRNAAGFFDVRYTQPESRRLSLDSNVMLPQAHTLALIERALEGQSVFNARVFDGSEGFGAFEINAVLTPVVAAGETPASPDIDAALLARPVMKAHMGVYAAEKSPSDALMPVEVPEYETVVTLHDNGIISHLILDYGGFVLDGELVALKALTRPKCP